MADRANFHFKLGQSWAGGKSITASASYFGFGVIFWMKVFFHIDNANPQSRRRGDEGGSCELIIMNQAKAANTRITKIFFYFLPLKNFIEKARVKSETAFCRTVLRGPAQRRCQTSVAVCFFRCVRDIVSDPLSPNFWRNAAALSRMIGCRLVTTLNHIPPNQLVWLPA